MADMTMILPYQRISPVHIPRRDLVLSSADSIWLTVTIVERDDPNAPALAITGGIGGPACTLMVWAPRRYINSPWGAYGCWDYGWGTDATAMFAYPGNTLWTGYMTPAAGIGSFEVLMAAVTMNTWPARCNWGVLLDWDGAGQAELIADGCLHVRRMPSRGVTPTIILTDPTPPMLTDTSQEIFIDGAPRP